MSGPQRAEAGTVAWTDLTVDEAERIRDFYARVAGWEPAPVEMGEYCDYNMKAGGGAAVAGICHRRGANAGLPSQWLIYILVTELDARIVRCRELGGKVIAGPRSLGRRGRYCVIEDPAGAVAALFEPSAV